MSPATSTGSIKNSDSWRNDQKCMKTWSKLDSKFKMSAIEETLERIKGKPGVLGYVVCSREGEVLRRMPSMSQEEAETYANHMNELTMKARHMSRDLNPKDELKNLRIRTKTKELIVSHDTEFIIVVMQEWMPHDDGVH